MKRLEKWAALTFVVAEGQRRLGAMGHTLIQKLFYLLQAAEGVQLGYRFHLYYYGPYCAELWGDLNTLADQGYLSIASNADGLGYRITATDKSQHLVEQYRSSLVELGDKIQQLLDLLGGKPVRSLETMATTFYVYKDWREKGVDAQDSKVVAAVKDLKPHLSEEEIRFGIQTLKKAGFISSN